MKNIHERITTLNTLLTKINTIADIYTIFPELEEVDDIVTDIELEFNSIPAEIIAELKNDSNYDAINSCIIELNEAIDYLTGSLRIADFIESYNNLDNIISDTISEIEKTIEEIEDSERE